MSQKIPASCRRRILWILLGAVLARILLPGWGQIAGGWIAGQEPNKVSEAIGCFTQALREGESLGQAVEVMGESWKHFE